MDEIDWTDTEEIGFRLHEANPGEDPLTVRFTDLRDRVMALPGFTGTTEHCGEKILEAIQMAWLEEHQDAD
jgi:FeS assembly protein IscX